MSQWRELVRRVGRCSPLLVALDFDGTIAPIVEHPSMATIDAGAARAIERLQERPGVRVAIVSGRGRRDLRDRVRGMSGRVALVGSHGAELHDGTLAGVRDDLVQRLPEMTGVLREVASECPGAWVEIKPLGAALHVRHAEPARGVRAITAAMERLDRCAGLRVRVGMCVLDASASIATKGGAVAMLRHEIGAEAVVFFGDDSTDEEVFLTLSAPSVGVRVGHGATYADVRMAGTMEVVAALEFLDGVRGVALVPAG